MSKKINKNQINWFSSKTNFLAPPPSSLSDWR